MVRQGFWSSPSHPDDPWARLLFMAMWNFADDYGVGSCSTRELLGFAFPNDRQISESDLERLLRDIGKAYGVRYYLVNGRPYYCIPSWQAHQKVPHPSKTRNPYMDEAETWLYQDEHDLSCNPLESRKTVTSDSQQLSVNLSPKDKEKEKEKEKVKPPPSSGGPGGSPKKAVAKADTSIGTRLPEDWQPPDDVKLRLSMKYPNTRLDMILAEFVNYWTSLPGPRARKLDWTKTFINRVHEQANAARFRIERSQPTGTDQAIAKLSALAQKYSQEDNAQLPAGRVQGDDEGQGILAWG